MTTKELYDGLICKPDLHSLPEVHDNLLIWRLYSNAQVQAYCWHGDTCIDIVSNSGSMRSVMHWHPEEEEMMDILYDLGKKGNLLVLKKSIFGTSTFYMGPADGFPLPEKNPLFFGRKKWDGGKLMYLEQR